ncbi:MAG: DNA repair protein RadC [Clostridia bacterium]
MSKSITIKDMPLDERPRERLYKLGTASLSNAELIAILLRTGRINKTALTLAQDILAKYGGVLKLKNASVATLCEVEGIGLSKAAQVLAALELGRRAHSKHINNWGIIHNPQEVYEIIADKISHLDIEQFEIISLNTKNHVLDIATISQGTINSSLAQPREIFQQALKNNAAAIILVHNHPSGDVSPSQQDFIVTKRIFQAGEIMGIHVLDHIIVGRNGFFSIKESNSKLFENKD